MSMEEFNGRFRAEFLSSKRWKELRDAIELQQTPRQPVGVFAARPRRLCLRFDPDWPEADLGNHITTRMSDRYCFQITQANPQTTEELLKLCEKMHNQTNEYPNVGSALSIL